MRFDLYVECDNAAFDEEGLGAEIVRILGDAVARLADGELDDYDKYVNLRDINGDIVGRMRLK